MDWTTIFYLREQWLVFFSLPLSLFFARPLEPLLHSGIFLFFLPFASFFLDSSMLLSQTSQQIPPASPRVRCRKRSKLPTHSIILALFASALRRISPAGLFHCKVAVFPSLRFNSQSTNLLQVLLLLFVLSPLPPLCFLSVTRESLLPLVPHRRLFWILPDANFERMLIPPPFMAANLQVLTSHIFPICNGVGIGSSKFVA